MYTKGGLHDVYGFSHQSVTHNGAPHAELFKADVCGVTGDSLTGEYNPYWREQVSRHESATTPLSATTQATSEVIPMRAEIKAPNGYRQTSVDFNGLKPIFKLDTYLDTACDNSARVRAAQSIAPKLKGLVILGELRESLDLIRHPARGLRSAIDRYLKQAKRVRSRHVAKHGNSRMSEYRRDLADLYLENSFGWQPILNDISDGYDAYRAIAVSEDFVRFVGSQKMSRTFKRQNVTSHGFYYVIVDEWQSQFVEYKHKYYGEIKLKVQTNGLPRRLGTIPSEFIPALWELLPWSFVWDYFFNIGDVLNAVSTIYASDFAWVAHTKRVRQGCLSETVIRDNPDFVYSISQDGRSRVYRKTITRAGLPSIPFPSLQIDNQEDHRRQLSRFLNIAALITTGRNDRNYRR
jgi:hypothetical protein